MFGWEIIPRGAAGGWSRYHTRSLRLNQELTRGCGQWGCLLFMVSIFSCDILWWMKKKLGGHPKNEQDTREIKTRAKEHPTNKQPWPLPSSALLEDHWRWVEKIVCQHLWELLSCWNICDLSSNLRKLWEIENLVRIRKKRKILIGFILRVLCIQTN